MTRIDKATQRRIAKSVLWTERQASGSQAQPSYNPLAGGLPIRYAIASADIEHNAKGTAKLAKGNLSSASVAFTAGTADVSVINPIRKVWNGSLLMLGWLSYEADNTTDDDRWSIMQAWSASFIRGIAAADIAPGGTGTLNSVVAEDGTFTPTNASVYLPTQHVTAHAGVPAWAKLVWVPATNTSRWEIYSADCPEA